MNNCDPVAASLAKAMKSGEPIKIYVHGTSEPSIGTLIGYTDFFFCLREVGSNEITLIAYAAIRKITINPII